MESFDAALAELLKSQPGLSKQRIAEGLKMELNDEFRTRLDEACDKGFAHKTLDKFYPGTRRAY